MRCHGFREKEFIEKIDYLEKNLVSISWKNDKYYIEYFWRRNRSWIKIVEELVVEDIDKLIESIDSRKYPRITLELLKAKIDSNKLKYDLAKKYLELIGLEKLASIAERVEVKYGPPAPNGIALIKISINKFKPPSTRLKSRSSGPRFKAIIKLIYRKELLENVYIELKCGTYYTKIREYFPLCRYENIISVQSPIITESVDREIHDIIYSLYKVSLEQYTIALHIVGEDIGLQVRFIYDDDEDTYLVYLFTGKLLVFTVILDPIRDSIKVLVGTLKEEDEKIPSKDASSDYYVGALNSTENALVSLIRDEIEEYCRKDSKQFEWVSEPSMVEVSYRTSEALNDVVKSREIIRRVRLYESLLHKRNISKILKRIRRLKPLQYGESRLTDAVISLLDCEIVTLEHYLFGKRHYKPGDPSSLLKTLVKTLEHYHNIGYMRIASENLGDFLEGCIACNETMYTAMNFLLKTLLPLRALIYGKEAPLPPILAAMYNEVDLVEMIAEEAFLDKESLSVIVNGVEVPVSDQFIEYLSFLREAKPFSEYLAEETGQ